MVSIQPVVIITALAVPFVNRPVQWITYATCRLILVSCSKIYAHTGHHQQRNRQNSQHNPNSYLRTIFRYFLIHRPYPPIKIILYKMT